MSRTGRRHTGPTPVSYTHLDVYKRQELERIKAEKERREKEIRQLENRQKILLNKQHDAQRRLRTQMCIRDREIAALLLSLKHQGKTMILASHHSDDIDMLCDEVYEMESGKISKQTGGSSK